jgi:shikimate dehydrogenase
MDKHRFALLGQPVELSLSPQIHKHFAESFNQQLIYDKIEVTNQQFNQAVCSFFKDGGKGLNITVPHKQAAYQLAQVVSTAAEQAKAVNTLWMEDGVLKGDNTDGIGFINDCLAKRIQLQHKKILILGAGGAVRGILAPIVEQNPSQIVIANRTIEKAQLLSQSFSSDVEISATELAQIPNQKFEIVINGLSMQIFPEDLNINLEEDAKYYDLKYGSAAESGVNWAANHSFNQITDGWGMLVRQAAQSYYLWHNQLPSVKGLIHNPVSISE